jgi:hypothetical protein
MGGETGLIDVFKVIRNCNAFKVSTLTESPTADTCNTVRDLITCNASTAIEFGISMGVSPTLPNLDPHWKGGQGYDLGKPQNLKRSVIISLFDGTKFDVIAPKHTGTSFLVFPKK